MNLNFLWKRYVDTILFHHPCTFTVCPNYCVSCSLKHDFCTSRITNSITACLICNTKHDKRAFSCYAAHKWNEMHIKTEFSPNYEVHVKKCLFVGLFFLFYCWNDMYGLLLIAKQIMLHCVLKCIYAVFLCEAHWIGLCMYKMRYRKPARLNASLSLKCLLYLKKSLLAKGL